MVDALGRGGVDPASPSLSDALNYCLGCRACETACPSGVPYHRILEAGTRAVRATRGAVARGLVPWALLKLVKHPTRLRHMVALASRLRGVPGPASWRYRVAMVGPQSTSTSQRDVSRTRLQASPRVAFFTGCVQDALFPDANDAAWDLLRLAGYDVLAIPRQTCCGALHAHQGMQDAAQAMARANIEALESLQGPIDWVANTAGGCGGMMSEYPDLFSPGSEWHRRASNWSVRVRDWTTLLLKAPTRLAYTGSGERVTLQNSCHLINVEGGGSDPGTLLSDVKGDEVYVMPSQDQCCGSAGIYNIAHPDWALKLLDRKMRDIADVVLDRILVVNPGCQLQMQAGVTLTGKRTVVEHLATYLHRIVDISTQVTALEG